MIKAIMVVVLLVPALETTVEGQARGAVMARAPERPVLGGRYLFYLHGRIVEDQGADANSPDYGRYEYSSIVQHLADNGFSVISEVRRPNVDPDTYADAVVQQVRHLLRSGVAPQNVTVVGASKGAVIAMLVSSRLTAAIRYVFMANCNDYIFNTFSLNLHGHVLSIYEASDELGQTCGPLFDRSPDLRTRREIRLTTGLRHGFIFRPLQAWIGPAVAWAKEGASHAAAPDGRRVKPERRR